MAVGSLVWSGSATIPAAKPGAYGEVTVSVTHVATDKVVASISNDEAQATTKMKFKDFGFQIIKDATADEITFKSLVEQNEAVKIDYIVMNVSS